MLENLDEIDVWLKKMFVFNYKIYKNKQNHYIVDVTNGEVNLLSESLEELPVQFGRVEGDFRIAVNKLTTLKGCPEFVGGDFSCYSNVLSSLEHGPLVVKGSYYCHDNQIKSIDTNSFTVEKYLMCAMNAIDLENNSLLNKYIDTNTQGNTVNISIPFQVLKTGVFAQKLEKELSLSTAAQKKLKI